MDFAGGVNSTKVTTVQSNVNPGGLSRNELAWLINGTTRDGGITPRAGWDLLARVHDGTAWYQGGFLYEPRGADPYFVYSIGGRIIKADPATLVVTDLSSTFSLTNPAAELYSYFCQAEEFLIIQAGDLVTLPLFWDGNTLRRSRGITNTAAAPGTPGVNEIPAATCMEYYMGRLWYAQNRTYSAGDIVGGASGTAAYQFRDAVLNVTENPLCVGGDGFTVPSQAGNIRMLKKGISLDAALGEGRLFIGTREEVYALQVPVTRTNWIAATDANQPMQTVVQVVNGPVNDRSVVAVNGDLFFQSLEPGIRPLFQAARDMSQWGSTDVSSNVRRILQFNDRALMRFGSGMAFDNRMWQTALPRQAAQGVVHDALVPLDFMPISSFGQRRAPVWQGHYEGLQVLQLFSGDFGGRERAFALAMARADSGFDLWELTHNNRTDANDKRITTIAEFPALTWTNEFALKRLICAELWIDRLWGTVEFKLEWRPDGEWCWYTWHVWTECSPRNSSENVNDPVSYPLTDYGESYRSTVTLPKPPEICQHAMDRPADVGYQFQTRLTWTGFCRVRGLLLHAEGVERHLYANQRCSWSPPPAIPVAQHDALPSPTYPTVYYSALGTQIVCENGPLTVTGPLPAGVTTWGDRGLQLADNAFSSTVSQEDANAQAVAHLNSVVVAGLASGLLSCTPPTDVYAYFKCDEAAGGLSLHDELSAFTLDDTAAIVSDPGKIATGVRIGHVPAEVARDFISPIADVHWDFSASSFTVRLWGKFEHYTSFFTLFEADSGPFSLLYQGHFVADTDFEWYVDLGGYKVVIDSIPLDGLFHRIIFWWEKGVGIGIKIDDKAAVTAAGVANMASAPQKLYVGCPPARGSHTVDEIAIWKRKLTDAEMLYDWNSGAGRTYPDIP